MQNNLDPKQFRLKESVVAVIKGNRKLQLHIALVSSVGQPSIRLWLKDNHVNLTTYENLTLISNTLGLALYDLVEIFELEPQKKDEPVMA